MIIELLIGLLLTAALLRAAAFMDARRSASVPVSAASRRRQPRP